MKTVYLVRHSEPVLKDKLNFLDDINDYDKNLSRFLSVDGINKIKNISLLFGDIDYLYSSPVFRTLETANIISGDLVINVSDKFRERKTGSNPPKDFWIRQLEDENYKLSDGESRKDVSSRMLDGLNYVLNNMNDDEVSVIVSHGASITFLLLVWCKLENAIAEKKIRHLTFNGSTVINDTFSAPEIFKIVFDGYEPCCIERVLCKD